MKRCGSIGRIITQQFAALLLGSCSVLAVSPPERPQLENFDRRKAAEVLSRAPAATAALSAEMPGVRVDRDPLTGGAAFVGSSTGLLTAPVAAGAAVDHVKITKDFLDGHRAVFHHGAEALAGAKTLRDYTTDSNGVRTMVWQQQLDGVRIFEATMQAHVTAKGALVNISSKLVPDPAAAAKGDPAQRAARLAGPDIGARQAVMLAGKNLGEDMPDASVTAEAQPAPQGPEKKQRFRSDALLDVTAELCWLPVNGTELRLCWEVVSVVKRRGEMYRVLIDAQTGEALLRHSLTNYISNATYRVFTSDSPSPLSPGHPTPLTTQPPVVPRTLVTTSALDVTASPNGWIDDGVNETRGNNVDAHADQNSDNVADLPRPQGAPNRVFDFPMDLSLSPLTYKNAAVTQLFYLCNWMHDKLYALGFNEAAGNFQNNNFARGGNGNDAVQADAQDGSMLPTPNANNANFSTPADGSPGRMQMYVFDGPTPDRDGDFDAEIVLHEYTHGLSNRLVGGGVGISQLQPRGMGEGWSDFYGLALLSEAGDDVNANYAAGGYATFQLGGLTSNYYSGIRRYPYSTNLAKNPLTFKDIDPSQASPHTGIVRSPIIGNTANEVHNMGEVWCVTLWDARANLVMKHGFATGNQLTLRLVTDGMKLAPANPNFLQARDAIIQADLVANAGANRLELWAAFAKRGMGASASSPASSTTSGLVESFDLPDDLGVTPNVGFTANGPVGGPFSVTSVVFTLRNSGAAALDWTAAKTQGWLTLSSAGGTLAPGATTTVTAALNAGANALPAAIYSDTVTFRNTGSGAALPRPVVLRVGQPDYFTEFFDTTANDTANQSFTFTPNGSVSFYAATREAATVFPTTPTGGTTLAQGDDTSVAVTLTGGATVKLYGAGFSNFNVGSNGFITFTAGDTSFSPSFPQHFSFKRIAALFRDLDFSAQGTCTWRQLADRAAVTWQNVPSFDTTNSNNFQIEMFFDGRIRITILGIAATDGLIGLSNGNGLPPNFGESDFSAYPGPRMITVTVPATTTEGAGVITGAVTVSAAPATPLVVALSSSETSEVTVPATVTIPAGQTSIPFSLTVLDDTVLDGTQPVAISASAATYATGNATINVADNETATLSVTLPASASEGAGTVAGTVSVSAPPAKPVAVIFTSSNPGEAVAAPVIISAGQTSAPFTLTIVDDTRLDGTVSTTITAVVTNWTAGSAAISIQDNETRTLSVTVPVVTEGGTATGTVTIPGTLPAGLTVSLSSATPTRLSVPASAVIAAGATSASFTCTAIENAVTDGTQSVNVTASAVTFTPATTTVSVLDNDVHHLTIAPVASPQIANVPIPVTITAVDINGVWITGHASTLSFTGTGSNGVATITPATAALTGGQWIGSLAVGGVAANVVITATNTGGRTGTSNAFDLVVGPLDHFSWNTVPSPQTRNTPFAVTTMAKDAGNNTLTSFNGTATLSGAVNTPTGSTIVMTELNPNSPDEIEFMNVSSAAVNMSGWQVHIYDDASWPAPLAVFTIPAATNCAVGQIFRLQEFGTAPGVFPQFFSGGNISWTSGAGSHVAVLLRTAAGAMVDFVAAGNATPASIASPAVIPAAQWSGNPVAGPADLNLGYTRIGAADANNASNWSTTAAGSMGTVNPGLTTPFVVKTPVAVTPLSAVFTNGVWNGTMTVVQNGSDVSLSAASGIATGASNLFNVTGAPALTVTAGGLNATGFFGGPFQPVSFVNTLTNSGTGPMAWTASTVAPWIGLSGNGGTLGAGASTTVTTALAPAARSLELGSFVASVAFTNTSTGLGSTTRTASIVVLLPAPMLLAEPAVTTGTSNTLSWFGLAGSTFFEVQRATAGDFSDAVSSGWISDSDYTFDGLADGTLYRYRVRARRAVGTETAWSPVVTSTQMAGGLEITAFDSDGDGLPDAWETAHGLDTANPLAENGAAGDADQDGLGNLLELALGLDPQKADAAGALAATIEPNSDDGEAYLTIRHRRLLAPGTLRYSLEISSDLIAWHTITAAESEELAPPVANADGLTETIALRLKPSISTPGNESRHIRLRVSIKSGDL